MMNDRAISLQAAIDIDGLDEQIRCEMCRNPMHTEKGCDGNCKYDEKLYGRIMQILGERIKPLPFAQPRPSTEIQEILDYLDTTLHPIVSPNNWNVYAELHDMISMLPSVQPESKWIPCSERLPVIKEHHVSEPCIVYCENGAYGFAELQENIFGQVGWNCERDDEYHEALGDVLAWMPLPPAYGEEGE